MKREIPPDEFRNLPPKLKELALSNFTIDMLHKKISIGEVRQTPAKVINVQGSNHISEFVELAAREDLTISLVRTQKSNDPTIGSTLFWVGCGFPDRMSFSKTIDPNLTLLNLIVYTEVKPSDTYAMKKEVERMKSPGYAMDAFRKEAVEHVKEQ